MTPRKLPDEGAWKDVPAVIVGGGPSLREFNWAALDCSGTPSHNRHFRTIAINRAYRDVPTADCFFTEDSRVVAKFGHRRDFKSFKGLKLLHLLDDGYLPELIPFMDQLTVVHRKRGDKFWSDSWDDGLSVSSNSGIGALNIATIMGCKTVFCLGFDCRTDGPTIQNYHGDYESSWAVGSGQLADYASDFTHWAALNLRKRGVSVINIVNPNFESALTCWPKLSFEDFYCILKQKHAIVRA